MINRLQSTRAYAQTRHAWHTKKGDRFAAARPISMGLARLYGSTAPGTACGLSLRMDYGTPYLSQCFSKQIACRGIQPSYAFVEQPRQAWDEAVLLKAAA